MGDVKDIRNQEGIEKIKKLAKEADACLFCTKIETGKPFSMRPMSTRDIDDDGNLWFLSDKDSTKNMELKESDKVQLLFSGGNHTDYLSVFGTATILYDRQKIEEIWTPVAKAWFKEGKDDPNISVIKVTPEEGYYWDTKHGRLASIIKIAASMVSGKTADDGIEGNIKL